MSIKEDNSISNLTPNVILKYVNLHVNLIAFYLIQFYIDLKLQTLTRTDQIITQGNRFRKSRGLFLRKTDEIPKLMYQSKRSDGFL